MAEKQSEYSRISGLAPRDELAVSLRASSLKGVPGALLSAPHKGCQQARAPAAGNVAGGRQQGGGKWEEDKTTALGLPFCKLSEPLSHAGPTTACVRAVTAELPTGVPGLGEVAAARQRLPAARCPRPVPPLPYLPPSGSPAAPGPLPWHFWSVTSAQEAYKSTCVRLSPVQSHFQFTRNNYHPQISTLGFPVALGDSRDVLLPNWVLRRLCPVSFCTLECPSGWITARQFL